MPRSTRQKSSSKHGSSRETKDYSDSEKESGFKDRKGTCKEETSGSGSSAPRVSKELAGSIEKRKLTDLKDSKDHSSRNGDYSEGYTSSSKRRREKAEDEGGDRWNGGGVAEDEREEGMKKSGKDKEKTESKNKRREESVAGESDGQAKRISIGKSESKHRDPSGRKEGRDTGVEKDREREKKGKDGRSDKYGDGEESRLDKAGMEKTDNQFDRKMKKRRDALVSDKHIDSLGDMYDRHVLLEDVSKNGRLKDEKHRNKYKDDTEKENRNREDKLRDDRYTRDQINRSEDKYFGDDKEAPRHKKQRHRDFDQEHDRDIDRNCDYVRDHDYDREQDRNHEQARTKDNDFNRDRDWDLDHIHDDDRDWDRDHSQERKMGRRRYHDQGGEHERDRLNECYGENDGPAGDGRGSRYKESRGKRSPDDFDDYNVSKSRSGKTINNDLRRSCSATRNDLDTDRVRSHSIQLSVENSGNSTKWLMSPSADNSLGTQEESRNLRSEELRFRDSELDERAKLSFPKEATIVAGKVSNQRSEKPTEMDDALVRESSQEWPSGSKVSPAVMTGRSPSKNLERRHVSRSVRRSLESGESGRRGPTGPKDFGPSDERPNRDLMDKPSLDDLSPASSPFHHRGSHGHSGMVPLSAFRGGVGSPSFVGAAEEDGRSNSGGRHKRGGDHLRGQGNAWRGPPNWPSPMPNGFMPFQHGPHHSAFQPMMPQFPPIFGVRPSLDMNHSGIPYHMADPDRFSGHFRPIGWQNMMDGGAPHMWDGNNAMFRDETHLFGGPDLDQKRNVMNGRGWDSNAELWKAGTDDLGLEQPSLNEEFSGHSFSDAATMSGQVRRNLERDDKDNDQFVSEDKSLVDSPGIRDSTESSPKTLHEMTPDLPKNLRESKVINFFSSYLSRLDISSQLACPKLYSQFISVTNLDTSPEKDENNIPLVNLKVSPASVSSNATGSLESALFPASNDLIFQRALDFYKKQRGGRELSEDSQAEIEGQELGGDDCGETKEAVVVDSEVGNLEASIAAVMDTENEAIQSPCHTVQSLNEANGLAPQTESILGMNSEMDCSLKCQDETTEGCDVLDSGILSNPTNSLDNDTHLDAENVELGKVRIATGEGQGPVVIVDDPCKASDGLMATLDESESSILSRIHHSSESTR